MVRPAIRTWLVHQCTCIHLCIMPYNCYAILFVLILFSFLLLSACQTPKAELSEAYSTAVPAPHCRDWAWNFQVSSVLPYNFFLRHLTLLLLLSCFVLLYIILGGFPCLPWSLLSPLLSLSTCYLYNHISLLQWTLDYLNPSGHSQQLRCLDNQNCLDKWNDIK